MPSPDPKYYVYVYAHPLTGEILYVGKGSGDRAEDHLLAARGCRKKVTNKFLQSKIKGLLKFDLEPIVLRVFFSHDEILTYKKEIELIFHYKKLGNRLCNRTAGGEGFTSEKLKQLWQDKDYREKTITSLRKAVSNPDYKELQRISSKKYSNQKSVKEKVSIESKARWANKKFKEDVSAKISKSLTGNEKAIKNTKSRWTDKAYRNKMELMSKNNWRNKEYRDKVRSKMDVIVKSEAYKEKMRIRLREKWQDPTYREMMVNAQRRKQNVT